MPQHELWAASARSTGFMVLYRTADATLSEHGSLTIAPRWSKEPSARNGYVSVDIPGHLEQHLVDVITAGVGCWQWGLAGDVPGVVRSNIQALQQGYREGVVS